MNQVEPSTRMEEWIDRLNQGDPGACAALLAHAQDRLRLLVRRILRGYPRVRQWEQTSGVLQGVNLRLLRSLKPGKQPPPTALDFLRLSAYHIRNEILDLLRKRNPLLLPEVPEQSVGAASDPLVYVHWAEIHEYIAHLPEHDRTYFDLLYYAGMTQSEAARTMGIGLREVRKRWAKLRREMGEWLGNEKYSLI